MKTSNTALLILAALALNLPVRARPSVPAVSEKAVTTEEDELPARYKKLRSDFEERAQRPDLARVRGTWRWVDDGFNYVPRGYTMNGKLAQVVFRDDDAALIQYVVWPSEIGPILVGQDQRSLVMEFGADMVAVKFECRALEPRLLCKASLKHDPSAASRYYDLRK